MVRLGSPGCDEGWRPMRLRREFTFSTTRCSVLIRGSGSSYMAEVFTIPEDGAAPRWIENEYGVPVVLIGRNPHSVQNEAVIYQYERFGRLTAAPVPDPPDWSPSRRRCWSWRDTSTAGAGAAARRTDMPPGESDPRPGVPLSSTCQPSPFTAAYTPHPLAARRRPTRTSVS